MRLIFVVIYFVHTIDGIERHPPNQNPSRQQQQQQQSGQMKVRKCEQIEIEMCRELGYNITGMPNFVGHESQQDAQQQLTTFTPLIQYGCSSRLRFFLCSAYVPMCSEKTVQLIGPCAPLCESVRQRCEPVLMQFGFPWPLALNCSRFLPRNEDDSMCIEVPSEEPDTHGTTTANRLQVPETADVPHITTDSATGSSSSSSSCCDVFRNPSNYVALNRTRQCALLCFKDDVFNADQKKFADAWMSVWSGLCFVTTIVTILIFLIDMRRFAYPERALVYVAVCYNVCSVGYLVRLIGGRDAIACREVPESSKKVVVREGIENTECTFVFLLVYYFSMAGSIWCVVLTVLWFLNSGLERPYDSLARHGTLLHLIAWSVPSAVAIAVVVMRGVDADELTAMCHVGYHSQTMQLSFVLIPTAVFLLVDVAFFASGLVCSLRRRSSEARSSGRPGGKKEGQTAGGQTEARSSPIRIGAFLLVNLVLTACALSVQCYEYANRQQWPLQLSGTAVRTPNVSVLMLGVAVNLTVGIVSAAWLWRGESLRSLQRFCSRLSRCCCPGTRLKQQQDPAPSAAAAAAPDIARLQTPLATRGKPIYRVTTEAFERNGRSRHFVVPLKSSHHCRRHHHHHHFHHNVSLPLTTHNSPPPPPPPSHDKSSSRSPLRSHDLSSDVSML